jgi:hypothetical protein
MGIISVLCFIGIEVIIIYQHEGPLLTHLKIDIDIVPWEEASIWKAVFFISTVDRVIYRTRLKSNWPFIRPPPTAKVNLAIHQTPQQTHIKHFLLIFIQQKLENSLHFCPKLTKHLFSEQISIKLPKLHENPSSKSRVVPCGWTDISKPTVDFRNHANRPKLDQECVSNRLCLLLVLLHCAYRNDSLYIFTK